LFCAVTSRSLGPDEVNGEQYTFVTRAEMEKDILNKRQTLEQFCFDLVQVQE